MSDDKLDPPSPYINADSISQTCIQHLEPFCSRCIVHTVESDLLPISEISQSPSLDLFGEPITSSPYKDSPPIGRIKINTPSCSWKNSESSNSIQQICPHTDSGFSSWTGVGDSKTRSPPNLVPSCCALPHSVYAPLTSSNRDSDFMFSQSGEDLLSWDPENLNESDVNSRSFGTNPGPCLSNLPCANDLNEELSDRMFVRSMGDMVKNPPTWSAPWPCSNTYSSCAYIPCNSTAQNPLDMLTSYSETTPSNFSPFLSIGMNPVNQDMCDDPTSLDACGDMVNDITNETFATATGPSNLFPSIILPSCVYARENGSSTHLHRPIPTHDVNTNHNSPSSSNSCSSIINSYSNSNIWEQPNRKNGNNSSLHTSTCYTSNKRPRTVSYTVYLDSSHRKSSQAYRPGSAPLQHNNLLIPEEDSDSVDENNEDPKEIQDDNHCVHQRRNKKLNSKLCARRFSQNYSSRGECTTDEKTDIGESAYNSMHATASRVEHFNNSTNHIIYDRKGNRTDQLMNTHINLVSTDLSEVSSYQCLTNLPLPSDRSVQHNENCSITRTRNISPSNIASSHLVNSLPNSPLNNVIITNETDQVVNSRVISQPPMPDVVPRLGLHMYNISGSNFIPLHHHSTLSQPRCSSVPLVQTSINLHQNYPQHQQQHSLNCCDLFHFHCSQVNNPSFSAELVCDTLPNLDTELSHPSGRIHLTLLARRLASVGDELMISQSRVIRSRYNLPSDALYNGLRRASSSILSVWGISFSLTWLFASPIAYIRQTIGLIGQSLPRGTNTIISDSSSNTPNRNNFSRRRTATYSGGVMNPRHSLQTTLHELHQPADDTISPVHIDEGIHQISGSSQSRFPTQPSIVSSLYANPYHHYHHICCHHCQFSCRHVNNSERNSSFQAGTLMTNHSEGVEIRSDDSD